MLAYFDRSEPLHRSTVAIDGYDGLLVVSPFAMAEVDYLIATRHGVSAELAALAELAGGAWELPAMSSDDLAHAADIVQQHEGQNIGVADASNVVLAARYRTRQIATLDHRHFDVLRPMQGGAFSLVP